MVSAMGDAEGKGRGGYVLLDQNFQARNPHRLRASIGRLVGQTASAWLWPKGALALRPRCSQDLSCTSEMKNDFSVVNKIQRQ